MTTHWFFWLFLSLYFLHQFWETFLSCINSFHTQKNRREIPSYFKDKIDWATYQKSIDYNLERARFGLTIRWLKVPLIWGVILGGGFAVLDRWLLSTFNFPELTHAVAYCATVALILMFLGIPTKIYSQFVIEERYGFNKMTAKTFVFDFIKTLALSAVLGIPLLYLLFWLYEKAGSLWWLWAFGALFGFELLVTAVYPTLLAPIFNKFTPIEEGTLKKSILQLAQKINFKLSGIFTIDGSRRSSHSNAYFSGIGRMRRIVLFDTLRDQLTEQEIVSVLAHEMGHNKKRHIQKGLFLSFVLTLAGFWVLSLVIDWAPLYVTFRAGAVAPHKALVLFALFAGHFSFLLTPFGNWISRKYEYEADCFSAETTGDKGSMASSLVGLCKENLSNLAPHPLYSFYYYSHPTTLERIRAIEQVKPLGASAKQ